MNSPKESALPSLDEMKRYLRIEDIEEDDEDIKIFIDAAVEELSGSGIKDQTSKSYGLAIKLLVANYYSERRPQVVGTITSNLNYSLERIILRLKANELPVGDDE